MKTINITAPTSYNQLTKKQLLEITQIFASEPRLSLFRVLTFLKLTGAKILKNDGSGIRFKYKNTKFYLTPEEFLSFSKSFDFLTENSTLTNNLLPIIRVALKKYYGPSNSLFNITFGEYLTAENYFIRYNKTKDIIFLDKLIATLYRPKKKAIKVDENYKGDLREEFNDFLIDRRSKTIAKLPFYKKHAIYIFYSGSVNALTERFPLVFEGGTSKTTPKRNQTLILNDRVSKEFGITPDDARELMLYDVMQRLEDVRADAKELESKL